MTDEPWHCGDGCPFRGCRECAYQGGVAAEPHGIRVPTTSADTCGHRSPKSLKPCTRATGHAGRHHFAWTHLDGRIREVWAPSDCQACGQETADGAVCRECGAS